MYDVVDCNTSNEKKWCIIKLMRMQRKQYKEGSEGNVWCSWLRYNEIYVV